MPAAIATPPASVSVGAGTSAVFTVIATGTAPSYQWQRSNDGGATFADIAGAERRELHVRHAQLADTGGAVPTSASPTPRRRS